MKRCKDCKWFIDVNFESAVGYFCPINPSARWWADEQAEQCSKYHLIWWKFWRSK